jgi:hypothetical protein
LITLNPISILLSILFSKKGNIVQKKLELEREVVTRKRKINPLAALKELKKATVV